MNNWIFITGGCGYVGSHIAAHLKTVTDHNVMLIDKRAQMAPHVTRYCDIFADEDFSSDIVMQAIRDYTPRLIIHCADDPCEENGLSDPLTVWEENVTKTIKLLKVCAHHRVGGFMFLSTGEVYSDILESPRTLDTPLSPIRTYSRTKLAIEHLLRDTYIAHGMNSISFRTYGIAGCHHVYDMGPLQGSPYLVPKMMEAVHGGAPLQIFGNDYNTYDGTPVRDYLHVMDLAEAVVLGADWLPQNPGAHTFNACKGTGTTVQQMTDMCEALTGNQVPFTYEARRISDPPVRIGDPSLTKSLLGWQPRRGNKDIILDCIKWYQSPTYKIMTSNGLTHWPL